MSCFTLERRPAQYFNREICLRNAPALMLLQPPRVWYVTLFHAISLCQHCFILCCAISWFYIKYPTTLLYCSHCGKNCYNRMSLWRNTWAHSAAGFVQLEHQGVHCAVRCIVPELISFDDLRDKFLPPGLGSRATHYGNWVGISKARGLAGQLLLLYGFGWMVMIQKIKSGRWLRW